VTKPFTVLRWRGVLCSRGI